MNNPNNESYRSCVNCQYFLLATEGIVCNAFHQIQDCSLNEIKGFNTCPDFEPKNKISRFIKCHDPFPHELEALDDKIINDYNNFFQYNYFLLDSITNHWNVLTLNLVFENPNHLLLRPNGNCPIKVFDGKSIKKYYIKDLAHKPITKYFQNCRDYTLYLNIKISLDGWCLDKMKMISHND